MSPISPKLPGRRRGPERTPWGWVAGAGVKGEALGADAAQLPQVVKPAVFPAEAKGSRGHHDDGSLGYHGFVDALVRQELEKEHHYQGVLACGPKPMLK